LSQAFFGFLCIFRKIHKISGATDDALHGSGGGGTLEVKTEAPPVNYKTYINERKGTVEKVPEGVDPAFKR
jgi:hypothetical protein